ncbi:MAG: hypothetical protein JEZ05_09125 [Tenericutes bacterium]|nr:hypothetical protein [Mycoplasmatota bacterium]
MDKNEDNERLSKLLNPRTNMNSKFRSCLFDKITEYCLSLDTSEFFSSIRSSVESGYFMVDFIDNYTMIKERVSNKIKSEEWNDLERSEILDFFRKSKYIKESEVYVLLLCFDLSNFIINGNWQHSDIDMNSYYSYVLVLASELNKMLCDRNLSIDSISGNIEVLITFYKKERLLEYFLEHFNSIDWYVSATIRLSREFLRYLKINSKYKFKLIKPEESNIEVADIIVMEDEMLSMLVSKVRELFLNKSDKKHSSAFSYIIKITRLIDRSFKKKVFTDKLENITRIFQGELNIFSTKRNKENFHLTTYTPNIVFKKNVIQSETTINIPKVYEILDAFVDIYEEYREKVISTLSLSRKGLPKRVKIHKAELGDLYLKYTYNE